MKYKLVYLVISLLFLGMIGSVAMSSNVEAGVSNASPSFPEKIETKMFMRGIIKDLKREGNSTSFTAVSVVCTGYIKYDYENGEYGRIFHRLRVRNAPYGMYIGESGFCKGKFYGVIRPHFVWGFYKSIVNFSYTPPPPSLMSFMADRTFT